MGKCKLCYFKCSNSFFDTQFSEGGYSGFQVTGWSNGDKITPPPKKKKQKKTKKNLGCPTKPKHHSGHIFCFINNIRMTTSNCFEYAKNPHVKEIVTKKIPESKISNPKKSFNHALHLRSGVPPRTHLFKSLVRKSLYRYPVKFFKASIYFTC